MTIGRKVRSGLLAGALVAAGYAWCYLGMTANVPPFPQLSAFRQWIAPDPVPPPPPQYFVRRALFEQFTRPVDAVIIGDSLSASTEWQDLFPRIVVANRAMAGDTAAGVRQRLPAILALRPRTAVLLVGINDSARGRSVAAIAADFRAIVATLRAAGSDVILLTPWPCTAAATSCGDDKTTMRDLRVALLGMAAAHVTVIDGYALMTRAGALDPLYSYDGVHLNAAGVNRVRAALARPLGEPAPNPVR